MKAQEEKNEQISEKICSVTSSNYRIYVESDLSYIRKHPFHMNTVQPDGQ